MLLAFQRYTWETVNDQQLLYLVLGLGARSVCSFYKLGIQTSLRMYSFQGSVTSDLLFRNNKKHNSVFRFILQANNIIVTAGAIQAGKLQRNIWILINILGIADFLFNNSLLMLQFIICNGLVYNVLALSLDGYPMLCLFNIELFSTAILFFSFFFWIIKTNSS